MAQTHNIEIADFSFPENTEVAAGDTVVWTNRMDMNHTVTADKGEFNSGLLAQDETFTHRFDKAGTVAYHCEEHPGAMKGKVTVT